MKAEFFTVIGQISLANQYFLIRLHNFPGQEMINILLDGSDFQFSRWHGLEKCGGWKLDQ